MCVCLRCVFCVLKTIFENNQRQRYSSNFVPGSAQRGACCQPLVTATDRPCGSACTACLDALVKVLLLVFRCAWVSTEGCLDALW